MYTTLTQRPVGEGYTKPPYAHLRKLTAVDAEEIVQLGQAGWSQRAIGERYGCNRVMVWKILRGVSFWWATGLPRTPLSATCRQRRSNVDAVTGGPILKAGVTQLPDLNHQSRVENDALILVLWAQVQGLTARVAALEGKLNELLKSPDNSSLPPSKG